MRKMKKRILIILIFVFLLTGCHSKEEKMIGLRMYNAISEGNVQGVKEILEQEDVNLEKLPITVSTGLRKRDRRALGFAMDGGISDKEVLKLLVENGVDLNSKNDTGTTFLNMVAEYEDRELFEFFLRSGADPTIKDQEGYTGVDAWVCSYRGMGKNMEEKEEDMCKMLELLSEYGGEMTPHTLQLYLENDGYLFGERMIQVLRNNRKKLKLKEDLQYAVCGENDKLLKYLENHEVSDKEKVLCQAAAHCNVEVLKRLKEKGCDFAVEDYNGYNLAHIAAQYNVVSVLKYFVEEGIDPKQEALFGGIDALTLAAASNKKENVAFLRESGQEWQVGGFELPDVWEHVCEIGNEESIGLLLKDGFQPTDEEIVAGYQSCNVSTLNALIKYKIPYDKIYQYEDENLSGYSELCYFQPELAEKMYTEIPDLEITPEIFENVALCGSTAFVKILLADMKNPTPETLAEALDACVVRGNLELVEALVERGADMNFVLNASDMSKHTVMHTATKGSSISILTYLKENGGDMTVKDGDGYTPKDYER